MLVPELNRPTLIQKSWGYEAIYFNEKDKYCLKTLVFLEQNRPTSLHKHLQKHETFYVSQGILCLRTEKDEVLLYPGDSVTLQPGVLHQLFGAIKNTVVIEASTYDDPVDTYRINL